MHVLVIGDVHGQYERLAAALTMLDRSPELILLTGDLTLDPAARQLQSLLPVFAQLSLACPGCPVAYVPGNHDLRSPPRHAEARNIDGAIAELAGLRLAGLGGAGPARFGFPYEWTEAEADARLRPLLAGGPPDIWLCHAPPYDTPLDRIYDGRHVGSVAVRAHLSCGPSLFICGHIHEAEGVAEVDGVLCLNAGALGPPYEKCLLFLIEWDTELGPRRIDRLERGVGRRSVWRADK